VAPGNLEARLEMARLHQSRNDWTSAHREYKIIIALDQNSAQASTALEEIENYQARQNGSVVPVRSIRKRPAKPLPLLPSPRIAPGEITLQPPESLDIGKSGEKPDPAAMVASRRDLGLRYLNIREYRAAIKEFLIVLRLTPEDKDIYYFLASAYHGLEMYPEAYDYYKRVDRGRYVQVAQSGAKRTQKLAADQQRRTNP
jgi:tetratricopeptide (TPR) repeat protein